MTRTEALAAATKVVDDFAPRTNARGYSDGTLTPGARVELVLKVADWLLLDDAPATLTPIRGEFAQLAGCAAHDGAHRVGECSLSRGVESTDEREDPGW